MKLTRRTFLISSAAAIVYAPLSVSSKPALAATDLGGGRSMAGVLPAGRYSVTATMEFDSEPIEEDTIEFYWGPPGASAVNSQFLGCATTFPEKNLVSYIGVFTPGFENGELIVINNASQPMKAKVEMTEMIDNACDGYISVEEGNTISFDSINKP